MNDANKHRFFRLFGKKSNSKTRTDIFDEVIHRNLHPGFQFVQIGANDGIQEDPIRKYIQKYQWRGILIEPVKEYFERLVANYADCKNLSFENVAIDAEAGYKTIYKVKENHASGPFQWKNGIASLNPDHHKLSGTPSDEMEAVQVEAITWATLIDKHKIESLDLLQIDTEGYDAMIVRGIDFTRISPNIIRFEHNLTSGTHGQKDVEAVIGLLMANRYHIFADKSDCIAYLEP